MNTTKPWYRSATIWLNVAAALAMIVPVLSAQLGAVIGDDMALRVAAGAGLINTVVGILVRVWLTNSGITGRTDAPG